MRRFRPTLMVLAALAVLAPVGRLQAQPQAERIAALGFEQADVRSVMALLAGYGNVNIVTDVQVTGQVTMQLREVTWLGALTAVCTMLDLVTTPSLEVIAGGVPPEVRFITVMRRTDFTTREQQRLNQLRDMATSQPLETAIIRLNNSRAAEIQLAVNPLRSNEGTLNVDTRTNALIVRDYPENIDLIKEVIQNLDVPVRQIRIEAKLIEVNSDKMRELGLQWDLNLAGDNPLVVTQQTNLLASSTVSGTVAFGTGDLSLDATIAALENQGVANVWATPSISVLDNTQGRVFMGEQIPLRQLDVAGNVTIQLQQVGTELIVTPHVVQNNEIILELKPKRESFRVDPSAGIIISAQEAETTVTVRDGETAVIGGLKSVQEQVADTGVPILMDLPIIGVLFRYRTRSTQVRDLILFVTPRIERDTTFDRP